MAGSTAHLHLVSRGLAPRSPILLAMIILAALLALPLFTACASTEDVPSPLGLSDSWALGFDSGTDHRYVTGFKWRRTFEAPWHVLEPSRGHYDWTVMDRLVQDAQNTGQKIIWVYFTTPEWATSDWRSFMPADPQDLVRFLQIFWNRYAASGVIGAVEVWNEPNLPNWSLIDPDQYMVLTQTIHGVTRQAAPGVKIIGVSLSSGWSESWLRGVFSRGILNWLDVVTFHRYKELADSKPTSASEYTLVGSIKALRTLMAEYGTVRPLWITEAGGGTVDRVNGVPPTTDEVNAMYEAKGLYPGQPWRLKDGTWRELSEQRMAAMVLKGNVQSLAHGVQHVNWFAHPTLDGYHGYGWFVNADLSQPKLQVLAHERLAVSLAAGIQFRSPTEAYDLGDGTDLYIYPFRQPTSEGAWLWRQQRTSIQWPLLWIASLAPTPVRLVLGDAVAEAEASTMLGEPVPVSVEGTDATLPVGEDPVYLTFTVTGSGPVTPAPNAAPLASIMATPLSGRSPLTVAFSGHGTDSDGRVVSYRWDFGDRASSTEQNPTHVFVTGKGSRTKTFRTVLTVTDDRGATATAEVLITVQR